MPVLSFTKDILRYIENGLFREICEMGNIALPLAANLPRAKNINSSPINLIFADDTSFDKLKIIWGPCLWIEPLPDDEVIE